MTDRRERWWADHSLRTQDEVSRISPLLSESPFLIAQDIYSLQGFSVQRVAAGYNWRHGADRLGLVFAVDKLENRFYREHFQFAPARAVVQRGRDGRRHAVTLEGDLPRPARG